MGENTSSYDVLTKQLLSLREKMKDSSDVKEMLEAIQNCVGILTDSELSNMHNARERVRQDDEDRIKLNEVYGVIEELKDDLDRRKKDMQWDFYRFARLGRQIVAVVAASSLIIYGVLKFYFVPIEDMEKFKDRIEVLESEKK